MAKRPSQKVTKRRAKRGSKIVASVTVADGAVRIDIKKRTDGRGYRYYAEYPDPQTGKRRRPSLETDDLDEAKRNATELATWVAYMASLGTIEELARHEQSTIELGELCDAFRLVRMPKLIKGGKPTDHFVNLDRTIRVVETVLGRETVVCEMDATELDDLIEARSEGGFKIPARQLPNQFDRLLLEAPGTMLGPCEGGHLRR